MRNIHYLFKILLATTSTVASVVTAYAQDDQTLVGDDENMAAQEIVVTAQRRDQSLLVVPVAVTALGGDALAKSATTDSSQLATLVPNLTVNSFAGKTQPNFTMRGIGVGNEFNANQASAVGVYVDDAYIASRTSHGAQLFDLERIEALRGPQGTLFGRNTTGGAINMITRRPDLAGSDGYASAGYGNFDQIHLQGAAEITPVPGVLGIRLAADWDRSGPTFTNLGPGTRDPGKADTLSGRISLRFNPTDDLDIDLKAYGSRDILNQAPLFTIGATPNGQNPITGYTRDNLDYSEVEYDHNGFRRNNAWGFLGKINYNLSERISVSTLTSYDGGKFELSNDSDASPFGLMVFHPQSSTRQFNQELKFNYQGENLNLILGAYYGQDTTLSQNDFEILYVLQPAPADISGATGGFSIRHGYDQKRKSTALFAQADFEFDDHWSATAGFRYTWDRTSFAGAYGYLGDYDFTPILYTVTDPANPGQAVPTIRRKSSAPTGRLALTYTANNGSIIYASYNHGYRSGTFNGGAYLSNDQLNYVDPEYVNAYEIGAKGRLFDGRVTYALTGFYNQYKNQQTVEFLGITTYLRNAGKATTYGAELELTARATRNLTLRFMGGYLHAQYDELLLGNDPATGAPGVDLAGNQLPYAPKITFTASADWTVAEFGDGRVELSPSVNYVSRQWLSPYNERGNSAADLIGSTRLVSVPHTLIDGTVRWTNDKFSVTGWVKNILDEKYFAYGIDVRDFLGFDILTPNQRRTYGLTLRYDF